jgi:hypothetical protein
VRQADAPLEEPPKPKKFSLYLDLFLFLDLFLGLDLSLAIMSATLRGMSSLATQLDTKSCSEYVYNCVLLLVQ